MTVSAHGRCSFSHERKSLVTLVARLAEKIAAETYAHARPRSRFSRTAALKKRNLIYRTGSFAKGTEEAPVFLTCSRFVEGLATSTPFIRLSHCLPVPQILLCWTKYRSIRWSMRGGPAP
jgi:hypothetical protein